MRRLAFFAIAWMCSAVIARCQLTTYYPIPDPTTNWTTYTVPLVESAGWALGSPSGPSPSQSDFLTILSWLNGLTVRFNSNAQLFFDNVSLSNFVTSTFPACSTDGWMGGDNESTGCNSLIGNPPGSINNGGVLALFNAPAKFLGNQASAYGGNLTFDLMGNPGPVAGYVVLSATFDPTNAVPSGVVVWGDNYSGQSSLPVMSNVLEVAAGRYHSLVLKSDGTVSTYGWNTVGAPDANLTPPQLAATVTNVPPDLTNVVAAACGAFHNLALRANGIVVAWGNDVYYQTNVPAGLSNVVAIAGGGYHSLALTSGGLVVGWGFTNHVDGGADPVQPPANLSNVVAIAGGGFHSLALKANGTVAAWGQNTRGQTNVPAGLSNVVAVAAGLYHSLALRDNGTVIAWGSNSNGQTNVPAGLSNVVAIAAGVFFSAALKADGAVVAWGDNTFRQTNAPAGLTNVIAFATGGYHDLSLIGTGTPALQVPLGDPTLSGTIFRVSLPSHCGRVFRLEYKQALSDPNWTPLPLVAGNGGQLTLTDSSASDTQRFYRVRRW